MNPLEWYNLDGIEVEVEDMIPGETYYNEDGIGGEFYIGEEGYAQILDPQQIAEPQVTEEIFPEVIKSSLK